jgi:hypothetical protein
MLNEITLSQLIEWQHYARLEPFDETRADIRAAQITQILANINRDPKKHSEPFQLSEFILRFGEEDDPIMSPPKPEQTWQEQMRIGRMIAESYGIH